MTLGDCIQFLFPCTDTVLRLREVARTVDLASLHKQRHGTPLFLSVHRYRTLTDPNPFIRSRATTPLPRCYSMILIRGSLVYLPRVWGNPPQRSPGASTKGLSGRRETSVLTVTYPLKFSCKRNFRRRDV